LSFLWNTDRLQATLKPESLHHVQTWTGIVPQALLQAGSKEFLLPLQIKAEIAPYKPKTGSFQRSLTNVAAYLSVCVSFSGDPGFKSWPKDRISGTRIFPRYIKNVPTERSGIDQSGKCLPMGWATEVRFRSGIGIFFVRCKGPTGPAAPTNLVSNNTLNMAL